MLEQETAQGSAETQVQEEAVEVLNPFDESNWVENPSQDAPQGGQEPVGSEVKAENNQQAQQEAQTQVVEPDYNQFFKEQFGFESVDEAKAAFEQYKTLKADEIKPATEWLKDKEDDLYSYLTEKKRLEKLANADVNAATAFDILKVSLQSKFKDLSEDEITYKLNKQYNIPPKPVKSEYESDEEYSEKLASWESIKGEVEKEMVIDAKIAKPEVVKLSSELMLPDVLKVQSQTQSQNQQEVGIDPKVREQYLQSLERNFNSFNGFTVAAKDEDVEVAVSYVPTAEEKSELKGVLQDFNAEEFLGGRWISDKGEFNITEAMGDLYLLKNRDKIFQKIANEAVAKYKVEMIKAKKNINFNQASGGAYSGGVGAGEIPVEQINYIWENS